MFELLSMYNGRNNGEIFLSIRDATARLGCSDFHVAQNAFAELVALGLVERTFIGHFSIKAGDGSRASAWRLCWIGENGRAISPDEFLTMDIDQVDSRARKRMQARQSVLKKYLKEYQRGKFAVADSPTLQARSVVNATIDESPAVVKTPTDFADGRGEGPGQAKRDSTTHIVYHGDQGLAVEFVRTDLTNFLRRASDDDKTQFASEVGVDLPELEMASQGLDLPTDLWEKIRGRLALVDAS